MFQRVALENWHEVVPYVCFALIAGVFLIILVRALRMKKSEVDRIASLPLQDDDTLKNSPTRDPGSGNDSEPSSSDDNDSQSHE